MKKAMKFSMVLITTLLYFQSCAWNSNKTINNIDFKAVQYQIRGKDTTSIYGKLASAQKINGYPCAADWVKLSNNWILKEFQLSEDYSIYNIHLKKKTWVFFDDEFQLTCVLPQDTIIQGYLCKGGGGKKGVQTSFYSNGKLKGFFSPNKIEIGNISCKGGVLNIIYLHEDGSLKRCKLTRSHKIDSVFYKQNAIIEFERNGKVKE